MRLAVYHPRVALPDAGYTVEELFRSFTVARARGTGLADLGLPGLELTNDAGKVRERRMARLGNEQPLPGEAGLGELITRFREEISYPPDEHVAGRPAGEVLAELIPLRQQSRDLLLEVIELIQLPFSGKTLYQLKYREFLELVKKLYHQRALAESRSPEELFERARPEDFDRRVLTVDKEGLHPVAPEQLFLIVRSGELRPVVSTATFWCRFEAPKRGAQTVQLSALLSEDERTALDAGERPRLERLLLENYALEAVASASSD